MWSRWGQWSRCSDTCGNGTRTHQRTCLYGEVGDEGCMGSNVESEGCFETVSVAQIGEQLVFALIYEVTWFYALWHTCGCATNIILTFHDLLTKHFMNYALIVCDSYSQSCVIL